MAASEFIPPEALQNERLVPISKLTARHLRTAGQELRRLAQIEHAHTTGQDVGPYLAGCDPIEAIDLAVTLEMLAVQHSVAPESGTPFGADASPALGVPDGGEGGVRGAAAPAALTANDRAVLAEIRTIGGEQDVQVPNMDESPFQAHEIEGLPLTREQREWYRTAFRCDPDETLGQG